MLKSLAQKINVLLLSLVLFSGLLIARPEMAAAKAVKSIPFDAASDVVNVASIYDTTLETQKSTFKGMKSSKSLLKKAPGYLGSLVLKSEDGTKVITMSQWKDLESYEAFSTLLATEEPKASKSSKTKEPPVAPPTPVVLKIEKVQADEGVIPAIKGKEAFVEVSEFKIKNPEDKDKVVASVAKMMPSILLNKPAPQGAILLSSDDEVILLANWNCTTDFEETEKPPVFPAIDAELADLVTAEENLYSLVEISPAKLPKEES